MSGEIPDGLAGLRSNRAPDGREQRRCTRWVGDSSNASIARPEEELLVPGLERTKPLRGRFWGHDGDFALPTDPRSSAEPEPRVVARGDSHRRYRVERKRARVRKPSRRLGGPGASILETDPERPSQTSLWDVEAVACEDPRQGSTGDDEGRRWRGVLQLEGIRMPSRRGGSETVVRAVGDVVVPTT